MNDRGLRVPRPPRRVHEEERRPPRGLVRHPRREPRVRAEARLRLRHPVRHRPAARPGARARGRREGDLRQALDVRHLPGRDDRADPRQGGPPEPPGRVAEDAAVGTPPAGPRVPPGRCPPRVAARPLFYLCFTTERPGPISDGEGCVRPSLSYDTELKPGASCAQGESLHAEDDARDGRRVCAGHCRVPLRRLWRVLRSLVGQCGRPADRVGNAGVDPAA